MKSLFLVFIIILLSGCGPNIQYVKYNLPSNKPLANVDIWVEHFRNNGTIIFGTLNEKQTNEIITIYELGKLKSGSLLTGEGTKKIKLQIPANEIFPLYFRNTSSSGQVTTVCSGIVPLEFKQDKNYIIEFINWKPKEATFSNFTCELNIGEILEDGSVKKIAYIEQENN